MRAIRLTNNAQNYNILVIYYILWRNKLCDKKILDSADFHFDRRGKTLHFYLSYKKIKFLYIKDYFIFSIFFGGRVAAQTTLTSFLYVMESLH